MLGILDTSTKYGGMHKCGGLCWVSAVVQVWSCSLATTGSGSLDLDSGGLDLGPYTSLLLTKTVKKAYGLLLQYAKYWGLEMGQIVTFDVSSSTCLKNEYEFHCVLRVLTKNVSGGSLPWRFKKSPMEI